MQYDKIYIVERSDCLDISKIVEKINKGYSLNDISKKEGVSSSTVCRAIRKEGYVYNRSLKKYCKKKCSVSNRKTRSYTISEDAERKLKLFAINNSINFSEAIELLINKYC